MNLQYSYDNSYDPPAMIVDVNIRRLLGVKSVSMKGKIDTGADVTVIPIGAKDDLGLIPAGEVVVGGYGGRKEWRRTYYVNINIGDFRFDYIEVIAVDRDIALIGRAS